MNKKKQKKRNDVGSIKDNKLKALNGIFTEKNKNKKGKKNPRKIVNISSIFFS
jgi:hypothetical protein